MKKRLARHKWVAHCTISEMIDTATEKHYFIATVRGWNGFFIPDLATDNVVTEVRAIRKRIDEGDDSVFQDPRYYRENVLQLQEAL